MAAGTEFNDDTLLTQAANDISFDLRGGNDVLRLANVTVPNTVSVYNTEFVNGGSGDDLIRLMDSTRTVLNGRGGSDAVEMYATAPQVTLYDIASVAGSTGDDRIDYNVTRTDFVNRVVHGGLGYDTLHAVNQIQDRVTLSVGDVEDLQVTGDVNIFMDGRAYQTKITTELGSSSEIYLTAPGGFKTANLIQVSGHNTVYGSNERDIVRAESSTEEGIYNLGDGLDRLELVGLGDHQVRVSEVEAVIGNKGSDTLILESSIPDRMSIDLGDGDDTVQMGYFGTGNILVSNVERVTGYSGDDSVTVRTVANGMAIDLAEGLDAVQLLGVGNSVTISGVETISGGSGVDRITVSAQDPTGTTMFGNAGGDVLIGGAGNDVIVGGVGKDMMTGGQGADSFVFGSVADTDLNTRDIIYDFKPGEDRLVFENMAAPVLDFIGGAQFTGGGHAQARFNNIDHQLLIDSNGDGAMDMRMALMGTDGTQLSQSDFVWNSAP